MWGERVMYGFWLLLWLSFITPAPAGHVRCTTAEIHPDSARVGWFTGQLRGNPTVQADGQLVIPHHPLVLLCTVVPAREPEPERSPYPMLQP
jgi:hypothetical protein